MIYRTPILIVTAFYFLFSLNGCVTPEVATNYITSKKIYALQKIDVAVMPFLTRELTKSEIEDVSEKIVDHLSGSGLIKKIVLPTDAAIIQRNIQEMRGNSLRFYFQTMTLNKEIDKDLLERWESSWEGYLKSMKINTEVLKEICNKMGVTSVLQFAVTDIKKTRPIHRKVVAETTAEVWYALFLNDGEILLVGKSIASQANAWSGQLTPMPIEAVDAAIDDILDKFPL